MNINPAEAETGFPLLRLPKCVRWTLSFPFRFTLVQTHTVEFNQVAMANSEGSEVMLNRVMTKDNIGVAVLLEVNKDMFSGGKSGCASPARVQAPRLAIKS